MKIKNSIIVMPLILFSMTFSISNAQYSSLRVAVMPFYDLAKKSTKSSKSVSVVSDLTNSMHKYKFIKLIERSRMKKVMNEIELGMSGLVDERTAAKAGKIHGVQVMIIGSINGEKITGRAIHVETQRIISSASVYGGAKIENLGEKLASDIEMYLARDNLKKLRNDSPDIDLDVWVERIAGKRSSRIGPESNGKVRIGDKIIFHFKSNTDGYLTIVDVQPGGDVVVLFPNEIRPSNKIEAGREYSIPSKDDGFEITVSEPAGKDSVVAFFTKRKVGWLDRKKLTGEGFWTVKKKEKISMTRGFKITATKLKRRDWESLSIDIDVYK